MLRTCAGRFFVHDNGEDSDKAYWALRQSCAIFDVPERPWEIAGPDVVPFLEKLFARRISQLKVNRGCYAIACTPKGKIFMDGVLFRLAEDRFWYVQPDGDFNTWALAHDTGFDVVISDPHSRVLQIQGPKSFGVMNAASDGSITREMGYYHSGFFSLGGQEVFVSRTGWTGELGYEVYTLGDATDCPRLWNHLLSSGFMQEIVVGAMQSMNIRRIEAGVLDCGGDFDTSMTPFEAGLGKFVDLTKEGFIGREPLLDAGQEKRIYGLVCRDLVPTVGSKVVSGDKEVGIVTTGAHSPFLETGIGYVRFHEVGPWPGQKLTLIKGDITTKCDIIDPPFYDRDKELVRGLK